MIAKSRRRCGLYAMRSARFWLAFATSLTHSLRRLFWPICSCPFCIILLTEHFANTTYYHNKYTIVENNSAARFYFLRSMQAVYDRTDQCEQFFVVVIVFGVHCRCV